MLVKSLAGRNLHKVEGQLIVEWLLPNCNYFESLESDMLSIIKDSPFDDTSTGFYVVKDLPEYGIMQACKIPCEKTEETIIDLGF